MEQITIAEFLSEKVEELEAGEHNPAATSLLSAGEGLLRGEADKKLIFYKKCLRRVGAEEIGFEDATAQIQDVFTDRAKHAIGYIADHQVDYAIAEVKRFLGR